MMKKNACSVLLNWMPPSHIDAPSMTMSTLQKYMLDRRIPTKTLYWNLIFNPLLSRFYRMNTMDELQQLLPFISILNHQFKNRRNEEKIKAEVHAYMPEYGHEFLENSFLPFEVLQKKILNRIKTIVTLIDFSHISLMGVSALFYQWIPGIILAKIVKKKYPNIKIVMGGFNNIQAATQMLKYCDDLDFAIWGEGEYALWKLYNSLEHGSKSLENLPRLIFRRNNTIEVSRGVGNYALTESIPDFSDYFHFFGIRKIIASEQRNMLSLLIAGNRGCDWNQCKFCEVAQGQKYREATHKFILDQMQWQMGKYRISRFYFVANNLAGKSMRSFESLLDKLIQRYSDKSEVRLEGEITHGNNFRPEMFKKMKLAGFARVQIGFEAMTDSLLFKMNKKNRFAHNLYFTKFSQKYGIQIIGNIIGGVPQEIPEDVFESINNLHYFRYYLNQEPKPLIGLTHLGMSNASWYYRNMTENELANWNYNAIYRLIPTRIFQENRFANFDFHNPQFPNYHEWTIFNKILKYYQNARYQYKLCRVNQRILWQEICNGKIVKKIFFKTVLPWKILESVNERILSFEELCMGLKKRNITATPTTVMNSVEYLKRKYLLYISRDTKQILSIIDTTKIEQDKI